MHYRLLFTLLLLVFGPGCKDDQDRLREERDQLQKERQNLQSILDQNKTPPKEMTVEQRTYYGQIDQRIAGIDGRIATINYELSAPKFN